MHPGFIPTNHPNQQKKQGVNDSIDDRETPPCVFDPLHAEFQFTVDAAASHCNTKCALYYTQEGQFARNVFAAAHAAAKATWAARSDRIMDGSAARRPRGAGR